MYVITEHQNFDTRRIIACCNRLDTGIARIKKDFEQDCTNQHKNASFRWNTEDNTLSVQINTNGAWRMANTMWVFTEVPFYGPQKKISNDKNRS